MKLLLGIDIGSTGCKAALYNLTGALIASGYRTYEMHSPQTGWVEEDPDEWWEKTAEAIRECLLKSGSPSEILAVSVSGANATVVIDQKGKPAYPAIMQLDGRAREIAAELKQTPGDERVFQVTGNRIAPGMYAAPNLIWLKRNMPQVYSNSWKLLSANSYIVYKLTEKVSMDHTRCCSTMLFDPHVMDWSQPLLEEFGLDRNKLPDVIAPDAVAGRITREAAEQTGLPVGIPVAAGAQDTVAAAIGAGCIRPENPLLIIGTVARFCMPLKSDNLHIALNNRTFIEGAPYLASGGTNGGGLSLRWFAETFCQWEEAQASRAGKSLYAELDRLAQAVPKGSERLIYLPYIAGERAPIWDQNARGVFFGMSRQHHKGHFLRAVMEGVAYAVRQNMEIVEGEMGYPVQVVKVLGGGAKSPLWRQILADILGKPVAFMSDSDAETKGAAYLAGMAAGAFVSYAEAEGVWAEVAGVQHPDQDVAQRYSRLYEVYRSIYRHTRDDMKDLAQID